VKISLRWWKKVLIYGQGLPRLGGRTLWSLTFLVGLRGSIRRWFGVWEMVGQRVFGMTSGEIICLFELNIRGFFLFLIKKWLSNIPALVVQWLNYETSWILCTPIVSLYFLLCSEHICTNDQNWYLFLQFKDLFDSFSYNVRINLMFSK